MCGISGFFGKPNLSKEMNELIMIKMKILGLYNESRGVHSCGMYLNGSTFYGVDKEKLFSDFISNYLFDLPENYPILIHNRQATRGAHTKENCHPFTIGEVSPIVMVHNGTIDNIYGLCAKYKVNTSGVSLDSKLLGMIIYEHGPDVLAEYSGGAALIWTEQDYPGTGFVYHGASRRTKDGPEVEERPLFYLETEEGIYLSSIEDSLWAIHREGEMPTQLPHNIVYQIEDGKFKERSFKVNRGNSNVVTHAASSNTYFNSFDFAAINRAKTSDTASTNSSVTKKTETINTAIKGTKKESLVWRETLPLRSKRKDLLYFHKGRYSCNGELCHGLVQTTNKGVKTVKGGVTHYFWEGVMLVSKESYEMLCRMKKEGTDWLLDIHANFAYHISTVSMYPVTNLTSEGGELEDDARYKWYLRRSSVVTTFTPKYSSRSYVLRQGYLEDIHSSVKKEHTLHSTLREAFDEELRYSVEEDVSSQAELFQDNTSNFDKVFGSVEEAMETFTQDEADGILDYISDYIAIEEGINHLDRDELAKESVEKLEYAVKHKVSMRIALGDIFTHTLERYTEAARNMREEEETEPVGLVVRGSECCEVELDEEIDEELEKANLDECISDAITIIRELYDKADEMQEIDSDVAQEVAYLLYRKIDDLELSLKEVFNKFNLPQAKKRLNDELYNGSNKI